MILRAYSIGAREWTRTITPYGTRPSIVGVRLFNSYKRENKGLSISVGGIRSDLKSNTNGFQQLVVPNGTSFGTSQKKTPGRIAPTWGFKPSGVLVEDLAEGLLAFGLRSLLRFVSFLCLLFECSELLGNLAVHVVLQNFELALGRFNLAGHGRDLLVHWGKHRIDVGLGEDLVSTFARHRDWIRGWLDRFDHAFELLEFLPHLQGHGADSRKLNKNVWVHMIVSPFKVRNVSIVRLTPATMTRKYQ